MGRIYRFISYLVILIVVSMFAIPTFHVAAETTLTDIPAEYQTEIDYLIGKNVVSGYPDHTFRPKSQVTRAEAATMIGTALNLNGKKRDTVFEDVNPSSFASGYIQSAFEKGIIVGDGNHIFRPNSKITREEVAVILAKAFDLTTTSDVFFKDTSTDKTKYPYKAINQIATAGITAGYPDGSYQPKTSITRDEFAVFVARSLNKNYRVTFVNSSIGERFVDATALNVRKGPSTSYAVVGTLSHGMKVTIYNLENGWAYMKSGNIQGYVSAKYLITQSPISNKRIIAIDAGHGGKDPGASGNGLVEKEVNLAVSLKVQKLLQNAGIQVVMTRTGDTYPTLNERVDIAVDKHADTFLSIHCNTFGSESANGTETYYNTAALNPRAEASKQLATFIQNRLYKALGTTNRGVKTAPYQVITYNPLPSALVELGFLSNNADANKLGSSKYQDIAANAIYQGIQDYYNWKN